MIDHLPPPMGPVPNSPKSAPPRQRGASFQEWVADSKPPAGGDSEMPAGRGATDRVGDPAGPTSRESTVHIELQVRDAHGNSELVAMPWRLAAGGHLAQESVSAHQIGGRAPGRVPSDGPGSLIGAGAGQPNLVPIPVAASTRAAALPAIAGFLPARTPLGTAGEPDASGRTATATAAAIPLAIRLMRWMEQHGHDPSLWIRDYRLDEAGARAMAEAVRQMARDQGLQLERIVVNAREVWRAPAFATGKENIACP